MPWILGAGDIFVFNKSPGDCDMQIGLRTTGSFYDNSLDRPPTTITKCTGSASLTFSLNPRSLPWAPWLLLNVWSPSVKCVTVVPISAGCCEDWPGEAVTLQARQRIRALQMAAVLTGKDCWKELALKGRKTKKRNSDDEAFNVN